MGLKFQTKNKFSTSLLTHETIIYFTDYNFLWYKIFDLLILHDKYSVETKYLFCTLF